MGIFSSLKTLFQSKRDSKRSSTSTKSDKQQFRSNNSKKSSVSTVQSNNNKSASSKEATTSSPSNSSKQINSSNSGYNFQYKDGRRYHADAEVAYILPNDDDEADRVHEQHWILRAALQRNYHAPVTKLLEEGITVLDAGCGPATWTFEMGETYPRSKFHGIDASCVFPEDIKPANVEFVLCNIAKHIPYPDNTFDYVHQRLLFLGLTESDWVAALKELYRVLKPGGFIEVAEPDLSPLLLAGPSMNILQNTLFELSKTRGMLPTAALELEDRLLQTGFEKAVVTKSYLPLNHGGKVGKLMWADYRHAAMNLRPVLAIANPKFEDPKVFEDHINTSAEESNQSMANVDWYAVYAQKPFN